MPVRRCSRRMEASVSRSVATAAASAAAASATTYGASLRIHQGGKVTALTDGKDSDRNPSWSPDGQQLVFVSTRDAGDLELYRIARDGVDLTRLTTREGADWLPRWSR